MTDEQKARRREAQRRYRERHAEKIRAAHRGWRDRMTDEQRAKYEVAQREYRRRNAEKRNANRRRWAHLNPELDAFRKFVWREENREHRAAYQRAWQEKNREQCSEYHKAWVAAQPEGRRRDAGSKHRSVRSSRKWCLQNVKDKAAQERRIVASAEAAIPKSVQGDLRAEIKAMLVEAVYSYRFPIRLQPEHTQEVMREHFRQFSTFATVSLDDVIGEYGFTRGAAMGIY